MDRYYTMRPINLGGEVSGYRAELVGVGSGADALRTIMQNAINRVGVSITPIVCQQLFIEVFNAAVDFACDSGTSVNLADLISFKWNTRGKYASVDATVPKSALSLTAIVSPKITRNATPHFDLKLQPVDPTVTWIKSSIGEYPGVFARGMSLANVSNVRFVNVDNTSTIYATLIRGSGVGSFSVSSNGRELICTAPLTHTNPVENGTPALMQYSTSDNPDVYHTAGRTSMDAWAPVVEFHSATPQPYDLSETVDLLITGVGFNRVASQCDAFDLATGEKILHWPAFGAGSDEEIRLEPNVAEKVASAYSGGTLRFRFYSLVNPSEVEGEFNIVLSAYTA